MTIYTISEVLSPPSSTQRSDKYYSPNAASRLGDNHLLSRFKKFANLPMEGMSCGLIWWLLHASAVNGDVCKGCKKAAQSLRVSKLISMSGTGKTTKKVEYLRGDGEAGVTSICLKKKSKEIQVAAGKELLRLSRACCSEDVSRKELERCYIEQSEPLRAFAVALALWLRGQGGRTGWLRAFLFGSFAAREPLQPEGSVDSWRGYALRYRERWKTTVLYPSTEYRRGFQWLAVQKLKRSRDGSVISFVASPVSVYSEGHVMRVMASRDRAKELYLSQEDIRFSLHKRTDWRLLESWSARRAGLGPYSDLAYRGFSFRYVNFETPLNLPAVMVAGFARYDGLWRNPVNDIVSVDCVGDEETSQVVSDDGYR